MIYKTFQKVSNVCQLLDKSLYFETKTVDGITYTNNGDGTITINGTNTKQSVVAISTNYKLYKSHFYIVRGRIKINYGYTIQKKDDFFLVKVSNDIANGAYYYLPVGTYDNVVDKPQLFDLTEMYGAGHEPTTVEQFRQDFPDEMYDYSPYCFIKSYKNTMICKTKNLFPTSTAVGTLTLSGWDQSATRQFEEDKWYIGITRNNYYVSKNITEYELTENYVYYYSISGGYGLGRAFKCEPNQTYTISCKWINTGDTQYIGTGFYDENGNYLTNISSGASPKRFTIATPANCKWFTVVFSGQGYVYNIQIEKGSTATDFIPNGYIQSYKKSLMCKTKNLFDIPLTRGYPSDTTVSNTTLRTFTIGTYILGLVRNNFYNSDRISNLNISKNSISYKTSESGYGVSVPFRLPVGNTYTVSCKADNNFYPAIGISYYKEDGTIISYTQSEVITNNPVKSFTVPENTYYTLILFYGRTGNKYTFSNIQLELGSTVTDYVPYGHL